MSERLQSHEAHQEHEQLAEQAEAAQRPELNRAALEKQQRDQLEASRQVAETEATSGRLLAAEKDEPKNDHHFASHQLLKKDSYAGLLKQTRQQLTPAARQFSKVIHQKNIEAISNITAQTVARPSGLLGGGIGALLGSLTLLYYAKHYGFRYNYAFFLMTFVAGFGLGLVVELVARLFKRRVSE